MKLTRNIVAYFLTGIFLLLSILIIGLIIASTVSHYTTEKPGLGDILTIFVFWFLFASQLDFAIPSIILLATCIKDVPTVRKVINIILLVAVPHFCLFSIIGMCFFVTLQ